jgi:serine/threonine-protein kinase
MRKAILGAALLMMAATPAFAAQTHAAIAISANTGAWGRSFDYGTQTEAESAALDECRKHLNGHGDDCKVATWTNGAYCAAVAVSYNSDGSVAWGSNSAPTLGTARAKAMETCQQYAGKPCDEVVTDICSQNY